MPMRFLEGELVQTPFGKGTVREVRDNGRVVVNVADRVVVLAEKQVAAVDERRRGARSGRTTHDPEGPAASTLRPAGDIPAEIDLHGLTVEAALAAAERALSDAMLSGMPELRFIHGKTGGRIRAALHRSLGKIESVRSFRIDPRNEGVTIVSL